MHDERFSSDLSAKPDWFFQENGRECGPFTMSEIEQRARARIIGANTMVRREATPWNPASLFDFLASCFASQLDRPASPPETPRQEPRIAPAVALELPNEPTADDRPLFDHVQVASNLHNRPVPPVSPPALPRDKAEGVDQAVAVAVDEPATRTALHEKALASLKLSGRAWANNPEEEHILADLVAAGFAKKEGRAYFYSAGNRDERLRNEDLLPEARRAKCAKAALWCGIGAIAYPTCFTGPICSTVAIVLGCIGLRSRKKSSALLGILLAVASLGLLAFLTYTEIETRRILLSATQRHSASPWLNWDFWLKFGGYLGLLAAVGVGIAYAILLRARKATAGTVSVSGIGVSGTLHGSSDPKATCLVVPIAAGAIHATEADASSECVTPRGSGAESTVGENACDLGTAVSASSASSSEEQQAERASSRQVWVALSAVGLFIVVFAVMYALLDTGSSSSKAPENRLVATPPTMADDLGKLPDEEAVARTAAAVSIESGQASMNKKDYDKAIDHFNEAIRLRPEFAFGYVSRAHAWNYKKQYDAAIRDFNEAIRLNPADADVYFFRGCSWSEAHQYDQAITDFTEAIRREPIRAIYYHRRGFAWSMNKDFDNAIDDYAEAIRLDPKNGPNYYNFDCATAHFERGRIFLEKHKDDSAIKDFRKAIQLDPKYAIAYRWLAKAHCSRGSDRLGANDYDTAIEDFNEAIRLDSNYVFAYVSRGFARSLMNDYENAITDYNRAIRIDPKYSYAYYCRGNAWLHTKRYDAAIRDFDEAIRLDPESDAAHKARREAIRLKKGQR